MFTYLSCDDVMLNFYILRVSSLVHIISYYVIPYLYLSNIIKFHLIFLFVTLEQVLLQFIEPVIIVGYPWVSGKEARSPSTAHIHGFVYEFRLSSSVGAKMDGLTSMAYSHAYLYRW